MKKILVLLITFLIVSVSTYTFGTNVVSNVLENGKTETITIASGEAMVFSFARKIQDISFSKDSGFTIRTLEGGIWEDMSNNVSDYSPINGFLVRNISDGNLIINATYADIATIENTIFQKPLKAGWNLIGVAHKDDEAGVIAALKSLGESLPYSQILDFTGNGFVYSGENIIGTPNRNLDQSEYQIKSKGELENTSLLETLAYGLFVNIDSVISGSQNMTPDYDNCDEATRLLGLCDGEQSIIETASIESLSGSGSHNVITSWNTTPISLKVSLPKDKDFEINSLKVKLSKDSYNGVKVDDNFISSITLKSFNEEISIIPGTNIDPEGYVTFENLGMNIEASEYGKIIYLYINVVFVDDDNLIGNNFYSSVDIEDIIITENGGTQVDFGEGLIMGSNYTIVEYVVCDEISELLGLCKEIQISAIDAEQDQIRADKDNAILGQLKIVNDNDSSANLQDFGIQLETSSSGVLEILENVKFEMNGTTYDLETSGNIEDSISTFYSNDLDIVIPQGTTILTIKGDTLVDLVEGQVILMSLDADPLDDNSYNNLKIENNKSINEIKPNVLNWNQVEIINSTATISNVPLANVEVIKGATDIVALQFEIEAGEASYITADTIKAKIENGVLAANKDQVSEINLYKTDTSSGNLLDTISGSKITATGSVIFNGFEVQIDAGNTETFIITLSTVDSDTAIGTELTASIANTATDISLKDDESDTITLASTNLFDKVITVIGAGELSLTADANNEANEVHKQILAGNEAIIYSVDTVATNEAIDVETVTFTLNEDIKSVVKNAKLYLDDSLVATATNSDVTSDVNSVITFDNISGLEIPTTSSELRLAIVTENIGYEKIGKTVQNVVVNNVTISDATGSESAEIVTVDSLTTTGSNTFDVVPTIITASVIKTLTDGSAEIKFTANSGNNTQPNSSESPVVTIESIVFNENGSENLYQIYETNDSGSALDAAAINLNASLAPINGLTYSDNISIIIVPAGNPDMTYTLSLSKTGHGYSVDGGSLLNINMNTILNLGSKTY